MHIFRGLGFGDKGFQFKGLGIISLVWVIRDVVSSTSRGLVTVALRCIKGVVSSFNSARPQ